VSIGRLAPFSFPRRSARWSSAPRRRRRLERDAQSFVERALERGTIEHESDRAGVPLVTRIVSEQPGRQLERIAHADAERHVQLAGQRKEQQGRPGYSPRDAPPRRADAGDVVLAEQIVGPLGRSVYRK